jgi:phosphotransferase system IIB component
MQLINYTGDITTLFNQYWWVLILILIIALVLFFTFKPSKPKKRIIQPIEDEKIIEFIRCYGGLDNIENAELDGKRLKIKIKDMEKVDIEEFKSLGATGIFITGQTVKMVLPYDMEKLVNKINENINGGKL